jgi:hypothetical protein
VILSNSLGHDAEVFAMGRDQQTHRTLVAGGSGVFDVILPDVAEGHAAVLVGPNHPSGKLSQPVRYNLAELPEIPAGGTP